MSWFNNLAFRHKLMLPIGILAALLLFLGIFSINITGDIGRKTLEITDTHLPSIQYLLAAEKDLYEVVVSERSLLNLDVESERFQQHLERHRLGLRSADENIDKFSSLSHSAEIKTKLDKLIKQHDAWRTLTESSVAERSTDSRIGRTNAIEISFNNAHQAFVEMTATIADIIALIETQAQVASGAASSAIESGTAKLIAAAVLGLLICALTVIILPNLIGKPLGDLLAHIRDIAEGEGDLTARLAVASTDEIGQLAGANNQFIAKLQYLISQVMEQTTQLNTASERLAELSARGSSNTTLQQSEIDQLVTAINQMTATVQEVSRSAEMAADSARSADDAANAGKIVVSNTVSFINELATSVNNASSVIQKLEHEIGSITAVLDVIKGIAEQTNLLALNAAIEAARAGEQGRGFAVVADEVRNLASRTQESTFEIQKMIEALQSCARAAVAAMSNGSSLAQLGVTKAADAAASLDKITAAVTTISDMNHQIASASHEQSIVSEEINRKAIAINDLTSDNAEGVRATEHAAAELAGISSALRQHMRQFKV